MPTTTISSLLTDVTRQGGINTGSYSTTLIMRVFTIAAQAINTEVMRAMKDIDFQGEKSTHNLVANQREYLFPSDLLKVKKIDLKLDGSNFRTAQNFDESEVPDKLAAEADIITRFTNDNPFTALYDESFFIYSGTISAVTNGILLWYNKDIVGQDTNGNDITSFSASTDVPTLLPFAAQAMVLWAIIDWYESHKNLSRVKYFNAKLWGDPNGRPSDDRLIGGLMRQIINHYANKAPDQKMAMSSAHRPEHYE